MQKKRDGVEKYIYKLKAEIDDHHKHVAHNYTIIHNNRIKVEYPPILSFNK